MKRVIVIMLSAILFSTSLVAQETDSVDVKALVKQQMLLAQQKSHNSVDKKVVKKEVPVIKQNDVKSEEPFLSTSTWIKGIILIVASLIAAGVIAKRRYKLRKIENRIKLKQNVKQLREEQLVKPIDPRLQMIRKKLCLNSNYLNKPEKEVILAARKFSIAKEEIILASRLKAYSMREKMEATAQ